MDPRFAPAWIAFAHAFSFEGEHEHAVTAYSTCARLYTGSHMPLMFVGMEHIILSNANQALDALLSAQTMCDEDPLLFNERGVMSFTHEEYVHQALCSAISHLRRWLAATKAPQDRSAGHWSWLKSYSPPIRLGYQRTLT